MGGTDNSNNLIELTVKQHALEHKKLYKRYGKWEDKIAWQTLSGQMTRYEAQQQVRRLANLGKKQTKESKLKNSFKKKEWWTDKSNREKIIKNMMGRTNRLGIPFTKEQKRKISESLKGNTNKLGKTGPQENPFIGQRQWLLGKNNHAKRPDVREKLRLSALKREALKRQIRNNIK